MNILGIDTCSNHCSIAITQNGFLTSRILEMRPNKQAELLVLMIESALFETKITYAELNAIAITVGPGSFTGIKMGLAAAHAIATVQDIKCLGFTTLEGLAHQIGGAGLFTVSAGRGRFYCQSFNENYEAISDIKLCEEDEIDFNNLSIKGDMIEKNIIDVSLLCSLAGRDMANNKVIRSLKPIYAI